MTLYYKNAAFTWWERLPAANIAVAPGCHRLLRLETGRSIKKIMKKLTERSDILKYSIVNIQ